MNGIWMGVAFWLLWLVHQALTTKLLRNAMREGGGGWGGGTQIVEMLQTKLVLTGGARTQVRVRLRAGRRDARRHPHNRRGLFPGVLI